MPERLWSDRELETEGANAECPSLTPYLLEGEGPHPAIIVVPGGGYMMRAPHEGEPIAQWLNGIGVSAVVLNYRVAPFGYPAQLEDAQRAMRLVRSHAAEWRIDPQRVGVLGFSAGGHVAATVGTHYDRGDPTASDPVERLSSRPDLLVLCYPVISMGDSTHPGSRTALLGERQNDAEMVPLLSNEQQVTADTPPTFLWHTAVDAAVPVQNSLLFASALAQHQVPFELHVFEQGPHGIGLATDYPGAGAWPSLCATWLERRRFTGSLPQFDSYATLGTLRGDARTLAVLNKHIPDVLLMPVIEEIDVVPLRMLVHFIDLPEDKLHAIDADLAALG